MEAFRNALKRLILERFGDAMARQMETAWGSTSNLLDALWLVHAAIGEHLNPIIGKMEQRMTEMLDILEEVIKSNREWTLSVMGTITSIAGIIAGISVLVISWKSIIGIVRAVIDIFTKLQIATKILWSLFLRHPFAVLTLAISTVITGFEKIYSWILKVRNTAYKKIGTLEGLISSYTKLEKKLKDIKERYETERARAKEATRVLKSRADWEAFLYRLKLKSLKSDKDLDRVLNKVTQTMNALTKEAERRRKALEKKPKIPDIPAPDIKEPARTPYEIAIEKYELAMAKIRAEQELTTEKEYEEFRKRLEGVDKTEREKVDYLMRTYRFEEAIRKMRERREQESVQYVYERLLEEAEIQQQHFLHLQTFAEAYYQWRQQQEESIFKTMQDYCLEIEKTIHSVFVRAIEGAMTLRSAFQEVGKAIRRIIIEQIATELMKAMKISKAISKVVGFITTAIRGFFFGAPIPIPAMQKGGIITKPTLALLGEREREAVIPLSRIHEFIPRMNITVNIHKPTIAERMDIETIVSQITEGIKRAQPRMVHLAEVIRG